MYAATQIELITDPTVAGQVAEQMGWLSDPQLIAAYQSRSSGDQRDFRSWLAQIIIDNTKAKILARQQYHRDHLQRRQRRSTPRPAAEILRKVYIDNCVFTAPRGRRRRTPSSTSSRRSKRRRPSTPRSTAETTFERQNGLVMANDKIDVDSARLQALRGLPRRRRLGAGRDRARPTRRPRWNWRRSTPRSPRSSKVLGPNNPDLQALKSRRAALAATVAQERAANKAMTSRARPTPAPSSARWQAQKSKVIANSDKIGRLTQLQNEVNMRREELNHIQERITQYRAGDGRRRRGSHRQSAWPRPRRRPPSPTTC